MEIIGSGFLARHLAPLGGVFPEVTALAAGVPRQGLPDAAQARERALVEDVVARCRAEGRTLVFFSTASMYGSPGCRGREDEPVVPSTRYGEHKLGLETLIRGSGADHLILRLGYVLGTGGPPFRLVPALISQLRAGRVRVQKGACRDLVDAADLVEVIRRLLRAGARRHVVNVASGHCLPIEAILDHLERRLGVRAVRDYAPGGIAHCVSVAKLRRLLPDLDDLGFGPGYHGRAIDRYLELTGQLSR
ncbi:NAD dependent epimerase/dehydratase family protein [Sinosporangium album]|uniref:NAD dependent epimerase/dehydratase family protein n=1 Tax=Sinosporangium album TaxID=504805 RepID=A0A1G8GIB4_9ACTN|nr:NAD(P)-dependent oxidoreductase [Sinosporangium album]SDH94128.1 NAD dependent epimerase/dehydratase family protein [Sinosporangium album]